MIKSLVAISVKGVEFRGGVGFLVDEILDVEREPSIGVYTLDKKGDSLLRIEALRRGAILQNFKVDADNHPQQEKVSSLSFKRRRQDAMRGLYIELQEKTNPR